MHAVARSSSQEVLSAPLDRDLDLHSGSIVAAAAAALWQKSGGCYCSSMDALSDYEASDASSHHSASVHSAASQLQSPLNKTMFAHLCGFERRVERR